MRPSTPLSALLLALTLGLTSTACGSSDSSSDSDSSAKVSGTALTKSLPKDVQDRGYLTFATDGNYAPIASMDTDGKTLVGLDIDLGKALSKELGVDIRVKNAAFDSIIPGLEGDKYDAGMSWINDTDERRAIVDFVDYSQDGTSIVVPADMKDAPTTVKDMCGHKLAIQKGTAAQAEIEKEEAGCKSAGKPIDLQLYPDQGAANVALDSGRAEITILDSPPAAELVKATNGKFVLSGEPYGKVYHGVAVIKGSPLADPIAKAFTKIMENGTYEKAFKKWGLEDAAIDAVLLNGKPLS
jgi:polar amino acid transport system substrate-binding protein